MKEHVLSILRAQAPYPMEYADLIYEALSPLKDIPVCKADVTEVINSLIVDGVVETFDTEEYGERFLYLAHCGHDTPEECNSMGCQIKNPGMTWGEMVELEEGGDA
jgi:hypothetical protein